MNSKCQKGHELRKSMAFSWEKCDLCSHKYISMEETWRCDFCTTARCKICFRPSEDRELERTATQEQDRTLASPQSPTKPSVQQINVKSPRRTLTYISPSPGRDKDTVGALPAPPGPLNISPGTLQSPSRNYSSLRKGSTVSMTGTSSAIVPVFGVPRPIVSPDGAKSKRRSRKFSDQICILDTRTTCEKCCDKCSKICSCLFCWVRCLTCEHEDRKK